MQDRHWQLSIEIDCRSKMAVVCNGTLDSGNKDYVVAGAEVCRCLPSFDGRCRSRLLNIQSFSNISLTICDLNGMIDIMHT
jgi:hypothetical protein